MTSHNNHEISHYLTSCFHSIKKIARDKATAYYENHPLHGLPLEQRYAELCRLSELQAKQAADFDRQEYLTKGDQPQFLVTHFFKGNCYFSLYEQEKYQEALTIIELRKANDHLLAITGIGMELQRVETWMAQAQSNGMEPAPAHADRLRYLQSQLELLLSHDPDQAAGSKAKATRGPARKCAFGYQGTLELLWAIINELNVAVGYLRPPTTTQDFIRVVTAPVPSLVGTPIYMGCNNKQMVYIMNYFQGLFLWFVPATIGNSGLFYSKEGHLLKSHNLSSTICDHVEKRYAIDAVFKKHGIAMPREREIRVVVNSQKPVSPLPGSGGF